LRKRTRRAQPRIQQHFHARRPDAEPRDRNGRCFVCGIHDTDRVYRLGINERDGVPQPAVRKDVFKKDVSLLSRKLFGISQCYFSAPRYEREALFPIEIFRIQNGSDAHGTGERSSPGLVDANDPFHPFIVAKVGSRERTPGFACRG